MRAEFSSTYGNVVIIYHGVAKSKAGKVYTVYAHCSKLLVRLGKQVKTKDVIALTGNTGNVWPKAPGGYHGHYEVICTTEPLSSYNFYLHEHKPTELRNLLTGK